VSDRATLERRLANYRAALANDAARRDGDIEAPRRRLPRDLAELLAESLDGEVVRDRRGAYVRLELASLPVPVDRTRLARLPGQPPTDVPLVCLDTETTGLGSAAGTYAFLIGLGWWQGERFRTVLLLLPDQPHEGVLLDALASLIPPGAWLVTYNGRGFDWPLLVTRYRMARRPPPDHAGHLDLLPVVRRLYRHRLGDARLRTVEERLLGVERHEEVEGWEIPGRYLDFLRTGLAAPLVAVARHNAEDVRSLARLLAHVERELGDPVARRTADAGDVAGLARLYLRERRLEPALECLEDALAAQHRPIATVLPGPPPVERRHAIAEATDEWWSPARRPDFGGRPGRATPWEAPSRLATPWSEERLLVERAHVLRRLGRTDEAAETWADLAAGTTRLAAVAAVELAKLREHRLGDLVGALDAVRRGWTVLDRRRRLGRPEPGLEADLVRRGRRLRDRLAARAVNRGSGGALDGVGSPGWTSPASISTVASPS
jgi:hypothetical protein